MFVKELLLSSLTPDIMTAFVKQALQPYALTVRELDLILALLHGHVTTRELADALAISESTVSNHIDNISNKTGLGGKSEILAFLVQKLCRFVENARYFIRVPSVLVIDDHEDFADLLVDHYRMRGCQAMAAYAPDDALIETILKQRIDLIIVDVMLGYENGLEFLDRVRARLQFLPATIVISAASHVKESDAFDAGAIAWMRKPLDTGRLFEHSVNAFINADRHAGRSERTLLRTSVQLASGGSVTTSEIGLGGMAIDTGDLPVGAPVRFQVQLPGRHELVGTGTTVATTPRNGGDAPGSADIRFDALKDQDQVYLRELVRTRNILSFLPIDERLGDPPSAPPPKKKRGA